MGAFAATVMLITVLASFYIANKSTKPIRELTQSSIEITAGNLDTEINMESNDELGVLAQSFSTMRDSIRQAHDVLEQRVEERTAELKKLSIAVEQSPASVVITDPRGTIEYVNSRFCQVTGYTVEEAVGRNPNLLKSGKTPPEVYRKLWKTLSSGGEWRGELLNKKKNGEEFWESASISPIKNEEDEITHFVAVKEDITERKRMEQEILTAMEKAEEATRAKSDFLANMSHEIRTPMNAVIGMSHLALKTELTTKQQDYLNKIQSSANSLLGIINDILDFSKIEAGKLDMESVEFHLDEVLGNLANLVTVKAQEKENLEVLFATDQEVPRFLVGDPLRLGQVLINLANNAVKFTESGEIVVSTELLEQTATGLTITFSVRDTGIGLTRDQVGKLFQSFSQADTSTTRKFGGTGLGLTISKRLVNMMGGEIWVDSEPGQGTTFSFTANFGLGKEKVKKRLVPSSDLRGLKVLVVDDSATSRNILQDILESFSFEVTLAASGEEGLEEIRKADTNQPYELVLMDWKMPGMDGLEASEHIKNHQTLGKIPAIILVTAYGREEIMRQADQIGLDGFLIKPIGPSVLFDTIMQALGEGISKTSRISERNEESEDLKDIQGAQVLLVEDNEINQQVAKEILAGAGLNVTVANDGQEAVDAVKDSNYDAVLMDIQMPVMDGYEATKRIRKWEFGMRKSEVGSRNAEGGSQASNLQPPTSNIPIIAMTANAMAGDREKSLEAGMNDHVAKPIDTKELFSTLAKWIEPGDRKMQGDPAKEGLEDKTERQNDPMPELPGISVSDGLKHVSGNEKLYRKLLLQFSETNRESVNEIRAAIEKKDQALAVRLAHTVKGVAGTLGAGALAQVAGELEKTLKTAETGELSNLLEQFESDLNQVMHAIEKSEAGKKEKMESGESSGREPVDNAVVGPIMKELFYLMETDLVEARSRLEDLAGHLANSNLGEQFKMLENQMDIFDVPAALDTLKEIANELNLSLGKDR
jgi:PAS domain S-box-containing protein